MRPQQLGQQRSSIMGRPLGARDKYPRGTGTAAKIKILESENGELRREIADLKQELGPPHERFPGDAVELLEASQHGDYHPTWLQFRAAVHLYDRDFDLRRAAMDAERKEVEQERIQYRQGDATLEALIAQLERFIADRDDELAALIESGDVSQAGAKAIRRWFMPDALSPRLALPAPSPAPSPSGVERDDAAAAINPHPAALQAPTPPTRDSAAALPWNEPVEPSPAARLFADRPFVYFQTASGHRYESNSACAIEPDAIDPDDVKDLLRAGCRNRS
jgi:hypothetical protein